MIEEMTSAKVKALIQNYAKGKRYLEIGVFRGATLSSAGEVAKKAVGVDNFSQFDNGTNEARAKEVIKDLKNTFLIVGDCFEESTFKKVKAKARKYDVFFYDGDHKSKPTFQALIQYAKILSPGAIVIIDDWNQDSVREGLELAQKELNLELVEEHFTTANAQRDSYWNGIAVFELK